jgi:hypothetical protein
MKQAEQPDSHEGKIQRLEFPPIDKNEPMTPVPMEGMAKSEQGCTTEAFKNGIGPHPDSRL